MKKSLEIVKSHIKELDSTKDEPKGEMHGTLNATVDMVTQINNALDELMIESLKKEMDKLKRELVQCNAIVGNDMLTVTRKHKIEIFKPKEFKGAKSTKVVDNNFWGMKQYF